MKTSLIRFICAMTLGLLAFGANAQDELHLSVYCSPANHDNNPGTDHLSMYSIYLTELGSQQSLTDLQSAVLADPQTLNSYVYICHPVFWNVECGQYATLDMEQDATEETILDGRYECTANTVAIVVYESGDIREVQVIPSGDEYFPEFFDDSEWDHPGTGWSGGGEDPLAVSPVAKPSFVAYSSNGALVVKGAQNAKVEVYSVSGTLLAAQEALSDECRIQLPATGIYVVRVNGLSKKVFVK